MIWKRQVKKERDSKKEVKIKEDKGWGTDMEGRQ